MKKLSLIVLLGLVTLFFMACGREEEETITMGFVPMRDGDQLIESVKPLAKLLSDELGVEVKAFTATNYVGVVEALGSGQVDFGFIPPFAYVLANSENNSEVILTALNKSGESSYKSQFLVSADADIHSFSDLKGKTIAFVDYSSTSGYLFPAAHLMTEGYDLYQDLTYVISGGHDRSLQLLLNGDVDVAATFVDSRERYKTDLPQALDATRVLGYTQSIPNISVTVSSQIDKKTKSAIQKALLAIAEDEEGAALLKELFNMYGFVEATDSDYDVIRTTAKLLNIDLKNAE